MSRSFQDAQLLQSLLEYTADYATANTAPKFRFDTHVLPPVELRNWSELAVIEEIEMKRSDLRIWA